MDNVEWHVNSKHRINKGKLIGSMLKIFHLTGCEMPSSQLLDVIQAAVLFTNFLVVHNISLVSSTLDSLCAFCLERRNVICFIHYTKNTTTLKIWFCYTQVYWRIGSSAHMCVFTEMWVGGCRWVCMTHLVHTDIAAWCLCPGQNHRHWSSLSLTRTWWRTTAVPSNPRSWSWTTWHLKLFTTGKPHSLLNHVAF